MNEPNLNLQENEDALITIALAKTNGNRLKAANLLGIHVRSLYHKMRSREAELERPKPKIPITHKLSRRTGSVGSWQGCSSCGILNLDARILTTIDNKVTCKNCLKSLRAAEAKDG